MLETQRKRDGLDMWTPRATRKASCTGGMSLQADPFLRRMQLEMEMATLQLDRPKKEGLGARQEEPMDRGLRRGQEGAQHQGIRRLQEGLSSLQQGQGALQEVSGYVGAVATANGGL